LIKAKALKPGDTIAIVAPAGPVEAGRLEKAAAVLRDMGFKVIIGKSCYERWGYLAGQDKLRADDVNRMFAWDEIDGIICMRGGYGTLRILDLIDYDMISHHPKVFMGYSDITALLTAITQKSGLITFHGPMLTSDFLLPEFDSFTKKAMLRAVAESKALGEINSPISEPKIEVLSPGKARGLTVGGNMTLLCSTLGTPYEVDTRDKILLLEEIGEEPYRIDRMLTQLKLAGKLGEAEGIVLGQFVDCQAKDPKKSLLLDEVLKDTLLPLKKPVLKNVCFGHGIHKATIPIGVMAEIDGNNCKFYVREEAVK